MFVDRFISTPMFYPCNYGFMPKTLADDIKCIDNVSVALKNQIEYLFTYYKDLEENKWVKIDGWDNSIEAKKEFQISFGAYHQ